MANLWKYAGGAAALWLGWQVVQQLREEDLRGEVVLITGGSRGLGLLMAHEFGRRGCHVAICARDEDELARAAADLAADGIPCLTVRCDVTDLQDMAAMVERVRAQFGRIDILVNNAGTIIAGPAAEAPVEEFQRCLDVMFWGPLHMTHAVLPEMRARGRGRIVNITSLGGVIAVPHLVSYDCAKFAAVGLSEGLRAELAADGIRVTTVVPGTMRLGSHLNAEFRGRPEGEYTWFALSASLPGMSVPGERAARSIVRAVSRGAGFHIVGLPAQIAARAQGLFPGLTGSVQALINRWILPAPGTEEPQPGFAVRRQIGSRLLDMMTVLGNAAARRNNELPAS